MYKKVRVICALSLLAGFAYAQEATVLHSTFINVTGEYEVTVAQGEDEGRVDIVRHDGKSKTIGHYVAKASTFNYAVPSPANDHITISWASGNNTYVTVFRLVPDTGTTPVLSENTDSQPEFIHIDSPTGAGRQVMLLYSGRHHVGDYWFPETASLYLWDGTHYRLARKVPYKSRFEALIALQDKDPVSNQ